jgi:hypothetical protein
MEIQSSAPNGGTLLIASFTAGLMRTAGLAPASPGLLPERNVSGLPSYVILGIVALLVVVFRVIPLLRQSSGGAGDARPAGSYGLAGAAVCSRCGLPFSRSLMGINLVIGKLERCPHCGKWQVASVAGREALAAAEARLKAGAADAEGTRGAGVGETSLSAEERLRRQIEESKYERPQ